MNCFLILKTQAKLLMGVFVSLLFLCGIKIEAQSLKPMPERLLEVKTISRQAVNFEMGGNGLFYTLNYDRLLFQSDYYRSGFRIGFGIFPFTSEIESTRAVLFIPVELNNLFGPKKHHLELSIGVTYNNLLQGSEFWMTGRVGYRMQGANGGFFFRAGMVLNYIPFANPALFRNRLNDFYFPMPAVAWGFSIK
jgi:hypothetical protein